MTDLTIFVYVTFVSILCQWEKDETCMSWQESRIAMEQRGRDIFYQAKIGDVN